MSAANPEIWTIRKVMAWSTHFLRDKGSPTARLDAEVLLAEALDCSRIELYTGIDKPLANEERQKYRDFVSRRGQGEPVAYILNKKPFWKHDFKVSRDTLIPRPDSELLIEVSLKMIADRQIENGRLLDIGLGSGCLGISLAKELADWQVDGWEVDEQALRIAQENAQTIEATNTTFTNTDALDYQNWQELEPYDVIISNPPYVRRDEEQTLATSVVKYEPALALFADGNGLEFYEAYAELAESALKPNGFLAVEVGLGQAEQVADVFRGNGWQLFGIHEDLAEIPRVVVVGRP